MERSRGWQAAGGCARVAQPSIPDPTKGPHVRRLLPALLLLAPLCACPSASAPEASKTTEAGAVERMRADAAAVAARPEAAVDAIEVQHILIAFKGAPRMSTIPRSMEE